MSLDKKQKEEFFKDFRLKQLIGSENLTQTPEIQESRKKKQDDLNNIELATEKFFKKENPT